MQQAAHAGTRRPLGEDDGRGKEPSDRREQRRKQAEAERKRQPCDLTARGIPAFILMELGAFKTTSKPKLPFCECGQPATVLIRLEILTPNGNGVPGAYLACDACLAAEQAHTSILVVTPVGELDGLIAAQRKQLRERSQANTQIDA